MTTDNNNNDASIDVRTNFGCVIIYKSHSVILMDGYRVPNNINGMIIDSKSISSVRGLDSHRSVFVIAATNCPPFYCVLSVYEDMEDMEDTMTRYDCHEDTIR